jgi:hypothetical protein
MKELLTDLIGSPEATHLAQWVGVLALSLFAAWKAASVLLRGAAWAFSPGKPSPLGRDLLAALDRPDARLDGSCCLRVPSASLRVYTDPLALCIDEVKVDDHLLTRSDRRLVLRRAFRVAGDLAEKDRQNKTLLLSARLSGHKTSSSNGADGAQVHYGV